MCNRETYLRYLEAKLYEDVDEIVESTKKDKLKYISTLLNTLVDYGKFNGYSLEDIVNSCDIAKLKMKL